MQIRLATYNVHRFVGRDRRKDMARTGRVIGGIRPDIIALQEVEYVASPAELKVLLPDHEYHIMPGPTIISGTEHYGNVLLSRFPAAKKRKIDLSYPGREERGALDVDVICRGRKIRIITRIKP